MAQKRLEDFPGWTTQRSSSSSSSTSPRAKYTGEREKTTNSPHEKTPTSEKAFPWIYERRLENVTCNVYPVDQSGKWLMFYAVNKVDQAWTRAKDLYRSGQFPNIQSMKVSTAKPTGYSSNESVLIFYCGPASDEDKMLAIGRDLAKKMNYGKRTLHYKTDSQTARGVHGSTYRINLY